uniref:PH domain-containing protein n=1 Tax=Globodera rostochiensis TaxID=31243 RepID=A0A914IC01_GLORO
MFHHLAPTGLPQKSALKPTRAQHEQIERNINGAVDEILSTNGSLGSQSESKRPITYNLAHPDTVTLLKSLDAFFAHGLLKSDKCYWAFTREFIPSAERVEVRVRWACQHRRALSLAWLKDSLNRANLHFQMLSFISCADALKRMHYDRNACMRNMALLKRMCIRVDRLAELQFNIEPPYVFQPEDTPIALPTAQHTTTTASFDGTMSPIGSSNSSLLNGVANAVQRQQLVTPNMPLNIRRRAAQNSAMSKSFVGSFCEATSRGSFLDGLVDDLPEVDLSTLGPSTAEHVVRSDREQSYILDQMLRHQRKSFTNFDTLVADEEEEEEEKRRHKLDMEQNQSVRSYVPEDPETTAGQHVPARHDDDATVAVQQQQQQLVQKRPEDEQQQQQNVVGQQMSVAASAHLPAVPSCSSLTSSSAELKFGAGSSTTREDEELSELDNETSALIEGEVLLEGHEKISLGLQVCVDDVETVQHMFQVFGGHAAGQPLVRYLLLTSKFLYLLAIDEKVTSAAAAGAFDVVDEREFGTISPASAVVEEWPAEAFEQNQQQLQQQHQLRPPQQMTLPVEAWKFKRLHLLPLCDLDHLTVGIDAQTLCFHSKRRKFRVSPHSGHEQRLLAVETGSRRLGKTIAHCVRRAVEQQQRVWTEQRQRRRRPSAGVGPPPTGEEEQETTAAGRAARDPKFTETRDRYSPAALLICAELAVILPSSATNGPPSPPAQLYVSTSHSSHLGLLLKRFLRQELGMQQLEVVHHSLVYWHQSDVPREQRRLDEKRHRQQQQQQQSRCSTDETTAPTSTVDGEGGGEKDGESMECYMYVRELYQRSWTWRASTNGEWRQSYVVLSGSKLYQFSDSTYKFAQRSINMRDVVEQVYQAELVNDENYVFQLDFRDDAQVGGGEADDGPLLGGLQFSCPSVATMQKWIGALSLALSQSGEQPLPTACMAVLTETHVVFAQEGVNCMVDGFMRALSAFHVHEIAELCAIRTEFNSALVLRRNNGLDEWMLFREVAELDRLVERLRQQWNLPVQECSAEENLLNSSFNQLFLHCVRLPDLWHCSESIATTTA